MDLIFIAFFELLKNFTEIDPPYLAAFSLLFLGGGALEYYLLRTEKNPWILPAGLAVLEVICEFFYAASRGFDGLLFAIVGAACLFALLATAAAFLIFLIFHHNR